MSGTPHDVVPPKDTLVNYLGPKVRRDGDRPTDDLVGIRFRRICLECGTVQYVGIDYRDIGRVIRIGCEACGEVTKQRPVWNDFRYRLHQLGLDSGVHPL